MIPVQEILVTMAVMVFIVVLTHTSLRRHRDYKIRNATRKLELVLQPREKIIVICPQKKE